MARLLADENFSFPIVESLRELGHDVLTIGDIGKANEGWPDDELFLFAISQRRIILTKNRRHFYRLHQSFPAHPGIIACTENPDFTSATQRIHAALQSTNIAGQFIRIYRG